MTTGKKLGIWMDHSNAHMMELLADSVATSTIESTFTHESKEHSLSESENLMHNKEQHEQSSYYKKIGEVIKGYEEVLLFGPTTAKNELANLLKADHHFDKIKIAVKQADKMSYTAQQLFVKEYFLKSLA